MARVKDRAIYEFYHNYPGVKCSYGKFRQRVIGNKIPMEKAIKRGFLKQLKSPARIFWEEYEGKKASLGTFFFRLNVGLSKEETISPKRRKTIHRNGVAKQQYVTIARGIQREKSQISVIDITLKPEEASIFRSVYARMLSELENDLEFCEIPSDVPILTAKIKQLKEEIRVFNLYN